MSKVLLIVDMQKGFINKKIYSDLVVKIDDLIKKNTYDCYIFTKFINKNNSFFVNKLNWKNLMNEESQKICVTMPKNCLVFEKFGYALDKKHVKKIKEIVSSENQIDICGLQTDACVYAISLQLYFNKLHSNNK